MSVSAVASLRPLRGRCLGRPAGGLLSPRVGAPAARCRVPAVARRPQSSSSDPPPRPSNPPPKPPTTFGQFFGRSLGASLRNLAVALSPRGIRAAYRDSPVATASTLALLLLTLALSAVAVRAYIKAFYNADFGRFPEPVANSLRRAVYYTNVTPDPELALRFYKKAMAQCAELGLDPFSDEVLGIRIHVSFWLQKINNHKAAIDVLESVLAGCRQWVDIMEQLVRDAKVDARGHFVADAEPPPATDAEGAPRSEPPAEPPAETLWRKRERLLAKAIGTSVKLGELYADEHVLDPDKSHRHLVWAVETALREFQRRASEGAKPGEEGWLTPAELGGAMESLGHDYERRSQFQLAIPLFLHALRLCESPCHRAVLMNNLAAAFAQQPLLTGPAPPPPPPPPPPPAAAGPPPPSSTPAALAPDPVAPTTRAECLEAALNWARNAHAHARDVAGDERTGECDEACAAALCNWADVAAMLGKADVARAKYGECVEMSQRIEFAQGVRQAREGLARLPGGSVRRASPS